ncbi:MAG TPA: hypothetical protein VFO21_15285 [Vicinamibacterales bacterium]|nr:hypothetical protein [Vicinamibacterales bacterium]
MDIAQVPPAAVHAQLVRILASDTFRGAERSKTLLTFIVEEALQGRAGRLKDYSSIPSTRRAQTRLMIPIVPPS